VHRGEPDVPRCLIHSCYNVSGQEKHREDAIDHYLVPSDRVEHATSTGETAQSSARSSA